MHAPGKQRELRSDIYENQCKRGNQNAKPKKQKIKPLPSVHFDPLKLKVFGVPVKLKGRKWFMLRSKYKSLTGSL
jgi:hypothetical protein